MIGVIRVRWTETPAEKAWSDEATAHWMDPNLSFSLAHYMTRTSLSQLDMSYVLFPVLVMDNANDLSLDNGSRRLKLVNDVLQEVTRQFHPDWSPIGQVLLVFAQQTDLFGGGSPHNVTTGDTQKPVYAAVCDLQSSFDQIVQEVGHAFGFDHEVNLAGTDYMSPYSAMSSQSYGNKSPSFTRPVDAQLPQGFDPNDASHDPQRDIGPYMTPAQFAHAATGAFDADGTVLHVPSSCKTTPFSFSLTALDVALNAWPARQQMLAVLPSLSDNGYTFYLELRRNQGYDAGLVLNDVNPNDVNESAVPVALVIHAVNPATNRITYINRIPLRAAPEAHDLYCPQGEFVVRLNTVAADFSSCTLTLGGDAHWQYYGVGIDTMTTEKVPAGASGWQGTDTSPCFMFPVARYQYRYNFFTTHIVATASVHGYQSPQYTWLLNGLPLDPADHQIVLPLSVREFQADLNPAAQKPVTVRYTITNTTLDLTVDERISDLSALLTVKVKDQAQPAESSERSIWTSLAVNNVTKEWDQPYMTAQGICARRIRDVNDHYSINESPIHRGPPGLDQGVGWVELINSLIDTNPVAANAAINELAQLTTLSKTQILRRLK